MVKTLKAITNVLVVLMIFALLALGIVTIAVQFPSVQTFLVQTATARISEKMGYPIEITRVNIKWFDVVSLEGVSVKDTSQKQMIDVGRIDVNLNMQNIIQNSANEVHLDEVTLYQPNVHLVVAPKSGDLNIDGFINRIVELTSSDTPRPANAPENNTPFTIGKSKIVDGTFRYDDPRKPRDKGSRTFDYSHFELNKLNADLKDFLAQGDTISFLARNMKTIDKQTGMTMHDLDTRFLFCQKKMELKELSAHIGNSYIGNDISFHYNRSGDLGDFNHKVFLRAHFVDSKISSTDLGLFSTYVDGLRETWRVSGNFDGKVDDFELSHADIHFGQGSRLLGDLGFKGLPDNGPDMNLQLSLSKILPVDLVQYYPEW
ncbi:MAG: translocation/assembly module TamB, partial [Dyadobacter sp.]